MSLTFRFFVMALGVFSTSALFANRICLTFDDFPMPHGMIYTQEQRLDRTLDILKKHKIQAAFYCIGSSCTSESARHLLEKAALNQQLIANHSFKHVHSSALTEQAFEQDLMESDNILKRFKTFQRAFRFPYLDYGDREALGGHAKKQKALLKILNKKGYQDGYVTINTFDWYVNHQWQYALMQGHTVDYSALKKVYLSLLGEWINYYDNLYKQDFDQISFCHTLLLHANDLNALFLDDIMLMLQKAGWQITSANASMNQTLSEKQRLKLHEFRLKLAPSMSQNAIDQALNNASVFKSNGNDRGA